VVTYLGTLIGPLAGLHRPIYWLLWMMAFAACSLVAMKRAYYNERYRLPLIGTLALRSSGLEPDPERDFPVEAPQTSQHVF